MSGSLAGEQITRQCLHRSPPAQQPLPVPILRRLATQQERTAHYQPAALRSKQQLQICRAATLSFDSKVFHPELVQFPGSEENIYVGGRDKFSHLPKAFEGIKQIGFIGWGSQAPAQAQNLRDSLQAAGSDIKVAVGLRENSSSREEARQCGFKEQDGTLDEIYNVITASDFVILLISDGAQVGTCSFSSYVSALTQHSLQSDCFCSKTW